MSGPPDAIPPNALFEALCSIPRPFEIVDVPRKDPHGNFIAQTHMHVLTQQERMLSVSEAEKFAQRYLRGDKDARGKDKGDSFLPQRGYESQGYDDLYNNELTVQLLYRACRRVEDPKWPFFASPTQLRGELSGDEIGALSAAYHVLQAQKGPLVITMSEGEVDEWIDKLEKGAASGPLGLLSSAARADLILHLVARLSNSSMGTTSSGSPADDGYRSSDDAYLDDDSTES